MISFSLVPKPINRLIIKMFKGDVNIGSCILNRNYLYNFNIYPEFRGNGFSKHLLNKAEIINSANYDNITLHVDKFNEKALNLYIKNGYKKIIGDGDILYLEKKY